MADSLIETMLSNPYDSIIEGTNNQMLDLDEQIQELVDAINKLETKYPTSTTLNQLRERLNTLQAKKESLSKTNSSAKSLSQSFNQGASNLNTLQGIYDVKEKQLQQEKKKADADYKKMEDDIKRSYTGYINALGNATASENAIINANAGRQGASQQSTAEVRARNYLNNAKDQKEAYNNLVTNLNAIEENRLNSNAGYTQLSQANADNYLRQQVMNDYQTAEADKDRALQYGSSSGGGSSYNLGGNGNGGNQGGGNGNGGNQGGGEQGNKDTTATDAATSDLYTNYQKYGTQVTNTAHYQNNITGQGALKNGWGGQTVAQLDRSKVKDAVEKINNQYNEGFNLNQADGYITDKGYVVLIDNENRQRVLPLSEVSGKLTSPEYGRYYINSNGEKIYY